MKVRVALPMLGFLTIVMLVGGVQRCRAGPMQRAGAAMDRGVDNVRRSLGRASQATGQALDRAGRATGAAADRAGHYLHDKLMPGPARLPSGTPGANDEPAPEAPPQIGTSAPASPTR